MATAQAVESLGTPLPYVMIVWTTANTSLAKSSGLGRRLQQGTPLLVSFRKQDDAAAAHDVLLRYRAERLDEWTGNLSDQGAEPSGSAGARVAEAAKDPPPVDEKGPRSPRCGTDALTEDAPGWSACSTTPATPSSTQQ